MFLQRIQFIKIVIIKIYIFTLISLLILDLTQRLQLFGPPAKYFQSFFKLRLRIIDIHWQENGCD